MSHSQDHLNNPSAGSITPAGAQSPFPGQEIDALRRHICHILGFDIALIDIIRGHDIDNLIMFFAEDPDLEPAYSLTQLVDANLEPLAVAASELALQVKDTFNPYIGRASGLKEEIEGGLPYVIVPILDAIDESSGVMKGLVRVVSFDPDRQIEASDVSTLKLIASNLSTRMPHLAAAESKRQVEDAHGSAEQESVLVVHADRATRRRLSRALKSQYFVLEVEDSLKALEVLQSHPVDLLVVDSELKAPGGEGFCRTLKQSLQWKFLPVILVAPDANPNSKVEGLNVGADDCISDACLDAELLARARASLRLRKTERELKTQLQLLEDYSQRLEHQHEKENLAAAKLTKKNEELDQLNRNLGQSRREMEIRNNQDLLLRRISDVIRRSFNIDENVGEMLESLAGWLELDCCFVILPEESEPQDAIRREYVTADSYKIVEKDLDLSILEIFKGAFASGDILLVNDVKRDRRVDPFRRDVLSSYHLYSLFYVPITYEEKLLGILGGHKCESEAQWTLDNENFLAQVADQLAIGVTNARLYKRVERQAITDGLTGLFNHRTGQEKLAEQLRVAERYQRNLAVVMIDVDHFKSINDTYGHPVGDTVLKALAHIIRRDCRDVDIPVRYGGEEFLLILPEINQEGAVVVAERLRKTLLREVIAHDEVQLSVTASLGVAAYPEDAEAQHHLLELADKALYMSKRMGRNQVHTASDLMFHEFEEQKPAVPAPPPEADDKGELVPEVVEMVKAMAGALYAKSEYNKVHHLETARFSEMVAKVLGLNQRQVEQIRVAGLLHDVGLLNVPDDIINKPGQVTAEELRVLMQHPQLGAQMFRPIHALKEICDILENHHECWDGTGYPRGLKGEEIPLAARIVAIVDAYHAMISDRPYRPSMSRDKARRVLRNGAGTQFDPFLVDIFLAVLDEIEDSPSNS